MHEVKADIGPSILLKIDSIEIGAALIKPSCWIVF